MWFSIGLILCVSAVVQGAWEESTVVPVRLDPVVRFESRTEQWRTVSPEEEEKVAQMRVYRLDVFGSEFLLQLEPDQTFLAPGFVFHVVGTPEPTEEPKSGAEPSCFYSGTVNGEENSAAALNLCDGLAGGFYYQGEEYFIQPLNSTGEEEEQEQKEMEVHRIRRRGRQTFAEEGSSKCGVNEDEARVPKNLEKEAPRKGAESQQTGENEKLRLVINRNLRPAHFRMNMGVSRSFRDRAQVGYTGHPLKKRKKKKKENHKGKKMPTFSTKWLVKNEKKAEDNFH